MPKRYQYTDPAQWRYLGPAFQGIDEDLTALEASAPKPRSQVSASSPHADVRAYLPAARQFQRVTATATVFPGTSDQWAKPVTALNNMARIGFTVQNPSSAGEPLKVAEGKSLTDSYNPSSATARTDVPPGSEARVAPGTSWLTAHYTTSDTGVRVQQSVGV